jgi:ArsR family transcriptional regulator, arsenate/arsenite/antimonite-responsive transcriptional repressor
MIHKDQQPERYSPEKFNVYLLHNYLIMAKKELFTKDLQDTSAFFKALGHPARLAILKYLAETKVCMTGDISDELPLSRTTVNQHLKELKDLDLISGEISGARVNYCLNLLNLGRMKTILDSFIRQIGCCDTACC